MKKTFCSAIIVLAVAMFTACDNGSSVSSVEFEEIVPTSSSEEEIVPTSSSEEEIVPTSSSEEEIVQSSSSEEETWDMYQPETWDIACDKGMEWCIESLGQGWLDGYAVCIKDVTGLSVHSPITEYCLEREGFIR